MSDRNSRSKADNLSWEINELCDRMPSSFLLLGVALKKMRDNRIYENYNYSNFDQYLTWAVDGIDRSTAYTLIGISEDFGGLMKTEYGLIVLKEVGWAKLKVCRRHIKLLRNLVKNGFLTLRQIVLYAHCLSRSELKSKFDLFENELGGEDFDIFEAQWNIAFEMYMVLDVNRHKFSKDVRVWIGQEMIKGVYELYNDIFGLIKRFKEEGIKNPHNFLYKLIERGILRLQLTLYKFDEKAEDIDTTVKRHLECIGKLLNQNPKDILEYEYSKRLDNGSEMRFEVKKS